MKITYQEIAKAISSLGIEKAKERLNYFKRNGAISELEYIHLWDLIHGGKGIVKKKPDPKSDPKDSWLGKLWKGFWLNGREKE